MGDEYGLGTHTTPTQQDARGRVWSALAFMNRSPYCPNQACWSWRLLSLPNPSIVFGRAPKPPIVHAPGPRGRQGRRARRPARGSECPSWLSCVGYLKVACWLCACVSVGPQKKIEQSVRAVLSSAHTPVRHGDAPVASPSRRSATDSRPATAPTEAAAAPKDVARCNAPKGGPAEPSDGADMGKRAGRAICVTRALPSSSNGRLSADLQTLPACCG